MTDSLSDEKILDSWKKNGKPWTRAVRNREIQSREQVTNQAIIDALLALSPTTVLDIGCGEGWLCRALASHHIECVGIDAVDELITLARTAQPQRTDVTYLTLSYDDFSRGTLHQRFDALVCNFSLLGEYSVAAVLVQATQQMNVNGSIVVQTLHPLAACGDQPYISGWREGSWAGFSNHFVDPPPWYFRTLEDWRALFQSCGLVIEAETTPMLDGAALPASIIFTARVAL
ncbi:MAG: methyltransferase domain-containing protein [Alcanivoracaceae bacterium]|nr:methyltransferase domain-containing protein [Alcanivoracaceae bacterium]